MAPEQLGIAAMLKTKRETAMARLSPAARVIHFPTLYARVPIVDSHAEAKDKIRHLQRRLVEIEVENKKLTAEIAGLRMQTAARSLASLQTADAPMPDVVAAYLEALDVIGVMVGGRKYEFADLAGISRCRAYAAPRQVCMWLCRQICKSQSLPAIGRQFNRDHTTVMHALLRAPEIMAANPQLRMAAAIVLAKFGEST